MAVSAKRSTEARLTPASLEAFGVFMEGLLDFGEICGVKIIDHAAMTALYRQAITLPEDLLMKALARIIANWVWGNRLPLPAEIRNFVIDELNERVTDRSVAREIARRLE